MSFVSKPYLIEYESDKSIFIKVGKIKWRRLNFQEINFIQSLANHVVIYVRNNDRFIIHNTLKGIEERLPPQKFMRIHNSFIVNVEKVTGIEGMDILIEKKSIPISKKYWKPFKQKLKIF